MVHWLRLRAPNAGSPGLIPGQGTGSHMLQLKPSAAKEINIKKQASKQKMLFPLKKKKKKKNLGVILEGGEQALLKRMRQRTATF